MEGVELHKSARNNLFNDKSNWNLKASVEEEVISDVRGSVAQRQVSTENGNWL